MNWMKSASAPMRLDCAVAWIQIGIALTPCAWAADPPPDEQEAFLAAARLRAAEYASSLPDYICAVKISRSGPRISAGLGFHPAPPAGPDRLAYGDRR
jgi:hypothetical protein